MSRHIPSPEERRRGGLAITHGVRSKVVLDAITAEKVVEIKAFLKGVSARWTEDADEAQITLLARQLAIIDQIWSYVLQRGAIDSHGRPRAVLKQWHTAMNVANRQLHAMGLTPLARAELGVLKAGGALDLARLMTLQRNAEKGPNDGQAN
jgi:hypothetical protein